MLIAFDAKRFFFNRSGLGNYSRALIQKLNDSDIKYHLLVNSRKQSPFSDYVSDNAKKTIEGGFWSAAAWRSYFIYKKINEIQADIYHGLSAELPFSISKLNCKTVVTIHDLIYRRFPDFFPYFDRKIFDYKTRFALERADKIIAISQSTKDDIIEIYEVAPDRINVVPPFIQPTFENFESAENSALNEGTSEPYLLFVGGAEKRKNLRTLIRAYQMMKPSLRLPVVVLGKHTGKGGQQLSLEIQKNGLSDYFKWSGFVDQTELITLYRKALCTIYISHYEGFGLPIAESLFLKTPVISVQNSSLPEVVGPGGWLLKNANAAEELGDLLENLVGRKEEFHAKGQRGYEYIQKFQAKRTLNKLMDVYREVIESW